MARVYWTRPALGDVKDIAGFIGGSIVPEFHDPAIREILVRPYRVMYAVREEKCFVVAVVHGSRDLGSLHSPTTLQERTDDV